MCTTENLHRKNWKNIYKNNLRYVLKRLAFIRFYFKIWLENANNHSKLKSTGIFKYLIILKIFPKIGNTAFWMISNTLFFSLILNIYLFTEFAQILMLLTNISHLKMFIIIILKISVFCILTLISIFEIWFKLLQRILFYKNIL